MGSNENKSAIAEEILEEMLEVAVWRNVIWLHKGEAVYEIRNARAYGMRWTLDIEEMTRESPELGDTTEKAAGGVEDAGVGHWGSECNDDADKQWRIVKTTFRGFLEPIEGLDDELDGAQSPK